MAYVTVNNVDAIGADIYLPRVGAWHADLVVDQGTAGAFKPGAPVVISAADGQLSWTGAVRRAGLSMGTMIVRVVGGAGGLPTMLTPKAYQATTLRVPLLDALTACKETLSPLSDVAVLTKALAKWARSAQPAGVAVASLMEAAGNDAVWRVLADGTVWVGRETWRTNSLDYERLQVNPAANRLVIAADVPDVKPGETITDGRVSFVEHHFGSGGLRTHVWIEGA